MRKVTIKQVCLHTSFPLLHKAEIPVERAVPLDPNVGVEEEQQPCQLFWFPFRLNWWDLVMEAN